MEMEMEIVKNLGKGSFGEVDLVKFTDSDGSFFHCARKSSHSWNYEYLNREIQILSKLRGYRGIVRSYNDVLHEDSTTGRGFKIYKIFLEYAEGGTLDDLMDEFNEDDDHEFMAMVSSIVTSSPRTFSSSLAVGAVLTRLRLQISVSRERLVKKTTGGAESHRFGQSLDTCLQSR